MLTPITMTTTEEEKWSLYYASLKSRKMLFSFIGHEINSCIIDYENPFMIEADTLAVYGLKNTFSTVLNIGASRNVRRRTMEKYNGKTSGSIADMYFKDFYVGGVTVFYVPSYADMVLLELEYINIYKPLLNYQKAFYDTSVYRYLINEYEKKYRLRMSRQKPIHDKNFETTIKYIENFGKNQT